MEKDYRVFASLTADSFFELDSQLRYVYREGCEAFLRDTDVQLGMSCIKVMDAALESSHQLTQHHSAMLERLPIDLVIESDVAKENVSHTHIVAQPQYNENQIFTGYIGCTKDVTKSVLETQQIAHLASHDDLTGIINRREFEIRLGEIVNTQSESAKPRCLCFIDLDKFEAVNDSAGHQAGDQLLRDLTTLMHTFVRGSETLARLGGDEFGLLLEADTKQACDVAERIIDAISHYRFVWHEREYKVGASIGVAPITAAITSVEEVLSHADNACYAAKDGGRNQSFVYGAESIAYHQHRRDIARKNIIKDALRKQQFALYLQPVVSNIDVCDIKMREVLLRLECKNGKLLAPSEFMPIASKYDFMQSLDHWVVENSMLALEKFEGQDDPCKLSINLSPHSLNDDTMLEEILRIVTQAPVSAESVCFEFSESAVMRNIDAVTRFMTHLRAEGVEFALDNFGGGLSSLSYLRDLPIDYIKLDQSLIENLANDEANQIIVSSINTMAQQLGIKTVAKAVENVETRHCVTQIGLNYAQGFGVAKPREISQFLESVNLIPLPPDSQLTSEISR